MVILDQVEHYQGRTPCKEVIVAIRETSKLQTTDIFALIWLEALSCFVCRFCMNFLKAKMVINVSYLLTIFCFSFIELFMCPIRN